MTPRYASSRPRTSGSSPRSAERGVRAGQEALAGGLFVAGRAVDLPGEVEPGDGLRLQRRLELLGRDEVVFDRVAVAEDRGTLQARDRAGPSRPARPAAGWWAGR